jgi:hypothetical protein
VTAHHPLHPPRLDQPLRNFRAWTVEAKKRTAGDVQEKL